MTLDRLDLLEPGIEIELADKAPDHPCLRIGVEPLVERFPAHFDLIAHRDAKPRLAAAGFTSGLRRGGIGEGRRHGKGGWSRKPRDRAWVRIQIRRTIDVLNYIMIIHSVQEEFSEKFTASPRPGCPGKITAEQVAQILAVACESPKLSGRPITRWTHRELRDEVVKRGIVESISVAQVGRYLKQSALQPHRSKMWLNTTEKNPETFEREAAAVCQTYLDAPRKAALDGTHTVSVDEATSLQAIERNAPDKPVQPGSVTKQEFEYTRHGTTTLTAGLDVVTGQIVSPTLEATRTEPEFVDHIARTVNLDPTGEWIFIVDNLNTHASESLVNWVAEQCGIHDPLGKKTFAAFSNP